MFLLSSTIIPATGPKANAASRAGRSEKSIFTKDGNTGNAISISISTADIAENMAVNVNLLTDVFVAFHFIAIE